MSLDSILFSFPLAKFLLIKNEKFQNFTSRMSAKIRLYWSKRSGKLKTPMCSSTACENLSVDAASLHAVSRSENVSARIMMRKHHDDAESERFPPLNAVARGCCDAEGGTSPLESIF